MLSLTRGNAGTLMLLFTTEEALSSCAECQQDKVKRKPPDLSVTPEEAYNGDM